jgi:H+/gluconate symporter-like permease
VVVAVVARGLLEITGQPQLVVMAGLVLLVLYLGHPLLMLVVAVAVLPLAERLAAEALVSVVAAR